MSDAGSTFGPAFLGALEGSLSVLLTLFAGYCAARLRLLDHNTVHRLSKICSSLFLPCLIVEQMGPELTAANLAKLWIIPAWGLVSTAVAHLLGWLGQAVFKTPYWVIVASGRPNTSALPLLLLQSLETTGVLKSLAAPGADTAKVLARAKSYILLNVVVQQTITFQLAPSVLRMDDGKHADEEQGPATLAPVPRKPSGSLDPGVQDEEHVGLLADHDGHSYGTSQASDFPSALAPIADQPDIHWPQRIQFLESPLKRIYASMSPPLIAAIIALILGLIPALNYAFFDKDSALYSTLTQSVENLGELFVALQMFTVGAQLALVPEVRPEYAGTTYAMLVRFLVMPGLSLLFVWGTAGRGWYVDDKLVWFLLVLIPSGPSAMLLANVAEIVDVDQGPIASYLTFSYFFSPLMAAVCSLGLIVVEIASKRLS
ncbi:hypothetical protein BDW22DRAFT_1358095 [Trametopsis cervina]|nr:hypothetical protein BDW22DRAFT_1358095 [Trametopsis cervina]